MTQCFRCNAASQAAACAGDLLAAGEVDESAMWKRSKGRWYAVAERIEWEGHDRSSGRGDSLEHVATDSKDAAEKAARELIKKYADLFSERTAVRVDIHPEIEWRPPDQ